MIQFSFTSDRIKHTFTSAVAEVVSATKSKGPVAPMPPATQPAPADQISLYASFNVFASAAAKAEGAQPVETLSKSYVCLETDEPFAIAESLFLAEVSGTTV